MIAGTIAAPSPATPPMMRIGPSRPPTVSPRINPPTTAAVERAIVSHIVLTIRLNHGGVYAEHPANAHARGRNWSAANSPISGGGTDGGTIRALATRVE